MSETGGMPVAKVTCKRCGRSIDARSFPLGYNVPICAHCVNEERIDRAAGQTNIFDEGVIDRDPLQNNDVALPRKQNDARRKYFAGKVNNRRNL